MFIKTPNTPESSRYVGWRLKRGKVVRPPSLHLQRLKPSIDLKFLFQRVASTLFGILLSTSVSQAEVTTYTYDEATSANGIGRLTSVSDASGTTKIDYDSMGRINKTDRIIDTITYTTQTGYDLAGRTKSITYPDNDVVNYSYNGPLLSRVYKDETIFYVEYTGYNALGQPGTATFGNTVTTSYTYSNSSNVDCPQQNFRLCKVTTTKTGSTFQNIKYSYDTVGNISGITDALPTGGPHTNQTQSFGYDALYRLTSANGPYGAITYHYDKNGNMLCNSALGSTPTCDPTLPNYASNYAYGDPAHAHAVTSAAGVNYTYDANGNMTGRGTHVLAYDLENRLSSVTIGSTTTSFVYDGNGARVKKMSGSTFVYIGKLFECVAPCKPSGVWTGTKHIFAGSVRIASKPITTTGEISYYHPDHLGSTSVVTDKDGANTSEFVYYPFGDPYIDNAGVHYKYTGQERDNETALYFYNARYYDSRIGRFISADKIVQSKRNPQFLNRYSYVMNNPMRLIDPSGQVATCGVWGISCGNSGVNNACGNGNCSSVPPRGSGRSNTGNSCPPGGCSGMNGTSTGLTSSTIGTGPQGCICPLPPIRSRRCITCEMFGAGMPIGGPPNLPPMDPNMPVIGGGFPSVPSLNDSNFIGGSPGPAPSPVPGEIPGTIATPVSNGNIRPDFPLNTNADPWCAGDGCGSFTVGISPPPEGTDRRGSTISVVNSTPNALTVDVGAVFALPGGGFSVTPGPLGTTNVPGNGFGIVPVAPANSSTPRYFQVDICCPPAEFHLNDSRQNIQ